MEISEIKAAVDAGQTVYCASKAYRVIKDSIGQYLIEYRDGENYIGLHGREGTEFENKTTYGKDQFWIDDEQPFDTDATAQQIIDLLNRQRDRINDPRSRAATEITYVLGRITAHKNNIRSITKSGD